MEKLDLFFSEYYKCVKSGRDTLAEVVSDAWLVIQNVVFAIIIFPVWIIGKVNKKQD